MNVLLELKMFSSRHVKKMYSSWKIVYLLLVKICNNFNFELKDRNVRIKGINKIIQLLEDY